MDLNGKVVVVTGGSAGLGEQICYQAAKKGAIIVACARRTNLLEAVTNRCESLSGKPAYGFQLDVADPVSVENVLNEIYTEVGSVDVLVNDAGFGAFEEFIHFDLTQAKKMFEVNILGMMYFTQKIAIEMMAAGHGHIINLSSMAGKMATAKSSVYSATKFAVIGFSNALRLELKPKNVFVTTVCPGPIDTNFFDKADPSGNYLAQIDAIVLKPEKLAREIVSKMGTATREINRPRVMEVAARIYQLFPQVGDYLAGNLFDFK